MERLKELNYADLTETSGRIACPFTKWHGGRINFDTLRLGKNKECKLTCGKLFPRAYQEGRCPCWNLPKPYVKRIFWKKLRKAQGKEK